MIKARSLKNNQKEISFTVLLFIYTNYIILPTKFENSKSKFLLSSYLMLIIKKCNIKKKLNIKLNTFLYIFL